MESAMEKINRLEADNTKLQSKLKTMTEILQDMVDISASILPPNYIDRAKTNYAAKGYGIIQLAVSPNDLHGLAQQRHRAIGIIDEINAIGPVETHVIDHPDGRIEGVEVVTFPSFQVAPEPSHVVSPHSAGVFPKPGYKIHVEGLIFDHPNYTAEAGISITEPQWSEWYPWDGGDCPIEWAEPGEYEIRSASNPGTDLMSDQYHAKIRRWRSVPDADNFITAFRYRLDRAPAGFVYVPITLCPPAVAKGAYYADVVAGKDHPDVCTPGHHVQPVNYVDEEDDQ